MIRITIFEKDEQVQRLVVKGHAGYAKEGSDIVCSAVSSIVITSVNAILRLDAQAITYEEKEGFISIEVLTHGNVVDTLILNLIELLKELEKQYRNNVKINKEVSSC